jgi:hypothetical protein
MPDRRRHIAAVPEAPDLEEPGLDEVTVRRGPVLIDGALAPVFRVPDPDPGVA